MERDDTGTKTIEAGRPGEASRIRGEHLHRGGACGRLRWHRCSN